MRVHDGTICNGFVFTVNRGEESAWSKGWTNELLGSLRLSSLRLEIVKAQIVKLVKNNELKLKLGSVR